MILSESNDLDPDQDQCSGSKLFAKIICRGQKERVKSLQAGLDLHFFYTYNVSIFFNETVPLDGLEIRNSESANNPLYSGKP